MKQRSLVLILARDLADKLASAVLVVDHEGELVYFNERAEAILGQSFADAGEARVAEWAKNFDPMATDGSPMAPEDLPLVVALQRQQPTHRSFRIRGMDGAERLIAATAFPLFSRPDQCVGAAAIFW